MHNWVRYISDELDIMLERAADFRSGGPRVARLRQRIFLFCIINSNNVRNLGNRAQSH